MPDNEPKISVWNDLETFDKVGIRLGRPFISISKRKSLGLNAAFQRQAEKQIGSKEYVVLAYSKSNKAIVFEFTDPEDSKGAIKMSGTGKTKYVSTSSFFNYYSIDADQYEGSYIPQLVDIPGKGKQWVVFLDEKQPKKRSKEE